MNASPTAAAAATPHPRRRPRRPGRHRLAALALPLLLSAAFATTAPGQQQEQPQTSESQADAETLAKLARTEAKMREARRAALVAQGLPGEPPPAAADRTAAVATRQSASPAPANPRGPVDEAEFRAASEMMRDHTPNGWFRFDKVPANAPWRPRLERSVVARYRELQRVRERDPEQYKREIQELELEDEILGLARRVARGVDGPETEDVKRQLRERVAGLHDLRVRNRETRLQRLAATLEGERKRLEKEKGERDQVVEKRYRALLERGGDGGFGPVPGGPGGAIAAPPREPRDGRGPRDRDRDREGDGDMRDRQRPPGLPPLPPLPSPPSAPPGAIRED
jgi:hypothetical protein